ncbi:hypothetical protein [Brevibacillus massiliensis]|uniref:hypothetical protein n=1 Tax=Brevibacillus massiliensis TaxID=1118054 RepID=UPI00031C99A0|nr:hypothetical protein [Brevibacillus massiliensis]
MSEQTLRMQLHFYQQMMVNAKTAGDLVAHEVYKQITRRLAEELRQKETTACGEQTA